MDESMKEKATDTEKILSGIEAFQAFLKNRQIVGMEEGSSGDEQPDILEFTLLLSAISSFRRVPGIKDLTSFKELHHCETEQDCAALRDHLGRLYGVTDEKSLHEACFNMFHSGDEYAQFQSFWNGAPVFDVNDLDDFGKEAFRSCKAYAEKLRPYVGEKGFHAWDCNEQVGLCRNAVSCGIISDEEFHRICVPMAKNMAQIYDSWEEYAMSCLCGAVYFMFCQSDRDDTGLEGFFNINRTILANLLSEGGFWTVPWYQPQEKKWAITADQMKQLLTDWDESAGCLATDRILVDGCKVGYMYREEPDETLPDSGWRFFAGDESDEYTNDADNIGIYHLNTLCNYDPDIIPLLHAPYGTAYFRGSDGVFQQEELPTR